MLNSTWEESGQLSMRRRGRDASGARRGRGRDPRPRRGSFFDELRRGRSAATTLLCRHTRPLATATTGMLLFGTCLLYFKLTKATEGPGGGYLLFKAVRQPSGVASTPRFVGRDGFVSLLCAPRTIHVAAAAPTRPRPLR